ncbi:MAG: hypothetical protein GTO45_36850 [Candidatus Aminicenantes bacterium]|nr:hypothetical protein [Candidatus Aminicenantes bacterium]NIM78216.1 hypothetical protein [Candidatus Aminicenantes bacterium]NIN23722.1 hypothetical protein [Candidatus Aminicenantes bacterium]NIN47429.1 hypothetical protein [Candidatus Aminicenantes bacterium]NIN90357.1 hypothetical protein [Candidatus Aminicenantes bacterium]
MEENYHFKRSYRSAVWTGISAVLIPVVLAVVVEFHLVNIKISNKELSSLYPYLRYILIGIAAIEILIMPILKSRIISGKSPVRKFKPSIFSDYPLESDEMSDTYEPPGGRDNEFISRMHSASIKVLNMCISIACFGVILFLIKKNSVELYGFLAVSFLLSLIHFPRYNDWKRKLNNFSRR